MPIDISPHGDDPKLSDARAASEAMDKDRDLDCLNDLPPHLSTFFASPRNA